jgi:hypothetical protein
MEYLHISKKVAARMYNMQLLPDKHPLALLAPFSGWK